ncbi:hypothetical protein HJC23_001351 [Cyclotella cryptica]|uniref:Uncharacterized protein n=1 Tax=Cyclotella cryptica TaxID=29204 RepID=A0ABD3PP57_9STRA
MATHTVLGLDMTLTQINQLPSKLEESAPQRINVREIMALLEKTYPEGSGVSDGNAKQQWSKTRSYLYQYRANAILSRAKTNASNSHQMQEKTSNEVLLPEASPAKRKRVRTKNLSIENVRLIISFLQNSFPKHPKLQARILQNSPRILSQYHSIESRLIPTIEFIRGLYGKMPDCNGEVGGMIYEAIWRNTNLLLVRGVGYVGGGWEEKGDCSYTRADGYDGNGVSAVEDYLVELGVSPSGIVKLKTHHPTLFQLSLKHRVKPAVEYLFSLLGNDPSNLTSLKQKKQFARILTNYPMLLHLDVGSNLEPTARFLQSFCDMTDKELSSVIVSTPGILGLSLESNLRPTLQFIFDNINGTAAYKNNNDDLISVLRKCILKHPQILALSLSNLRAKMHYFDQIDQLRVRSKVRNNRSAKKSTLASRILVSAPSTYSLSLKNIAEKIEYLAAIWKCISPCTYSSTECPRNVEKISLSDMLQEYPQILTLSMEGNIKPTMAFYNMSGYIDLNSDGLPQEHSSSAMQDHSIIRGRYIATSLYNRLLPRWHYLGLNQSNNQTSVDVDITQTVNTTPLYADKNVPTTLPPLHLLAGASDEDFCRQMNLSIKEYHSFKKAAAPQLKFNSQFEIWLQTGRPININASNR